MQIEPESPAGTLLSMPTRWWIPPVLRLAALLAAVASLALLLWLGLRHVDLPSAGSLIEDYGYLGVAAGAFGDSFGLPSSGEVVLLVASAASAASSSHFDLPVVIAVAWVFAVLGDACAYAAGRAAGPRLLHRLGVHEDSSVHRFMERHGARAVVAGRLVGGIRTKLAIVSGSTRMPAHRYIVADAIGAAIWAVLVGLLGYVFSSSVQSLTAHLGSAGHALGGVAVSVAALATAYLSARYVLRYRPQVDG
jgi:membrane protein DedA with SNARE-associated domain